MLRPIRHGDHGEAVQTLQADLVLLGYDLPRFGVDGDAGGETFDAVNAFCRDHRLPVVQGVIPGELVQVVRLFVSMIRGNTPPAIERPKWLHDYTSQHRDRMGPARHWSSITGITLHQTATAFSSETDPAVDVSSALARVAKIKAHFVVLRNGATAFNMPLDRVAYHAQRVFNASDVGIEIDGYFAGVEGDLATFWKPRSRPNRQPMQIAPEQVANGRALIRWICKTVAANGGEIRHIHAHRQTHRGKPSDPGESIWRALGSWAKTELGLTYELDDGCEIVPHKRNRRGNVWSTSGPGRPIPKQWDEDQPSDYRSK